MAVSDEQIGRNVLRLRADRSQGDVAQEMRRRGWKWSQTTVWKVEAGERPLRLTEAVDLADILGVFSLATPDHDTILLTAMRDMEIANGELESAVEKFLAAQFEISGILDELSISPDLVSMANANWTHLDPKSVVEEVERRLGPIDSDIEMTFGTDAE